MSKQSTKKKYRAYSTVEKTYVEIVKTGQCVARFSEQSFEIFDCDSKLEFFKIGKWSLMNWCLFKAKVRKHLNFIIDNKHKPEGFLK